jgi:hypothetical protein
MSTKKLSNISIAKFQSFLDLCQCKMTGTNGGHEKWTRSDLMRPITIQTHIDPIPEFIIKNTLRGLGYSKNDFFDILDFKLKVCKNEKGVFIMEKI